MTKEEHRRRHVKLHGALDELAADFLLATGKRPSTATVLELIEWSHAQTIEPVDPETAGTRAFAAAVGMVTK